MSFNTFGKIFRFTTWGESHGPAIGCVVDGCPPNIPISEKDIQTDMNRRRPGKSKFTSQRKESDKVEILSVVFQGKTTGTPISMIIYNKDARSRDYETIKDKFRPGHADYTYFLKYGIRDYRGGGRQSARETASRVAAGAIAKIVLNKLIGKKFLNKKYFPYSKKINFNSIRKNEIIGKHEVTFSSGKEIITLNHEAFDRSLYAEGALTAAKWLMTKKPGLYSMRNLMNFR